MIAADRAVDVAYQRLSGDSTFSALVGARISRDPIVPVAAGLDRFPYATVGLQTNVVLNTINGTRIQENAILRVRLFATMASGQGWAVIRSMAERADTLLQRYSTTSGSAMVGAYRLIETVDTMPDDIGTQYVQRTMLYRVEAHAL